MFCEELRMAFMLKTDHRVIAVSTIALTSGLALYSTYKYLMLRKRKSKEGFYESDSALSEYLIFHYGSPDEILPYSFGPHNSLDFPKKCAEICMKNFTKKAGIPSRALDIGCGVGRSTFEMTKLFDEVIGIDYSQSFINACNKLKSKGKLDYSVITEGDLHLPLEAVIDPDLDRTKTIFQQGDACNLSPNLGQFGCVLAANLICRLHSPVDFLNRLASLVATDGILVITSPYVFLTEHTPKDKWIGGYKDKDGKQITGFDGLKRILAPAFDLVSDENVPFFIRETARKNQWTVAHVTVWRRKS